MNIVVRIRDVYGVTTVYPVCEKAKLFAEIAGTRTLTRKALAAIAALGVEVKIEKPVDIVEVLDVVR
jgi:hypothetical protein